MKPNPEPPPCWGGLLICSWPLAILISIFVQCFITAWRIDHQRPPRRRRHAHRTNSTRPRETREEARQRKYRYLYQVRTARGDIISQVCVFSKSNAGAKINYFFFLNPSAELRFSASETRPTRSWSTF